MYGVRSTRVGTATPTPSGTPTRSGTLARSGRWTGAGMWQGAWVRVTEGDEGVTCEVMGLGHRSRQDRTVSLGAARRLAAHGVPLVVRKSSGHRVR